MDLIFRIERAIDEVRRGYAPDLRLAVFEVELVETGAGLALVGATSEPAAAEELHRRIAVLGGMVPIRDEIERLPAGEAAEWPYALVRAAVAPFLAQPVVSAAIISQAVLGQRLSVLRAAGRWLQCRSDDGYLGWVHRGYLRRCDGIAAAEWEMGSGGEACLSLGALVIGPGSDLLARLPWGARVVLEDDGRVRLPDGERGQVQGDLVPVVELAGRFPPRGSAVVETATRWIAAPYLWGGITPSGVDCSGLAQAVYRTHGLILPRDSDLQALFGEAVDPGPAFGALCPGDLLFFAEEPGRVSHVAISRGGPLIIHASLGNGGVRRNDLLGALRYERELRRLFVGARRVSFA